MDIGLFNERVSAVCHYFSNRSYPNQTHRVRVRDQGHVGGEMQSHQVQMRMYSCTQGKHCTVNTLDSVGDRELFLL